MVHKIKFIRGTNIYEYKEKGNREALQYVVRRMLTFKIDLDSKQEFLDTILETTIEINSKEELKKWIQTLLSELNWK